MKHRIRLPIATAAALLLAQAASAKLIEKDTKIAGVTLHYKVVLPNGYDPATAYPAVLAFPPGSQDMSMVDTTIARNWQREAEKRGYIVIVPAAPNGELFFEGGSRVFPQFITQILHDYKIRENKLHIAGMSNGGISAFFVAAAYPQYFWSVTGFPGYLPDDTPQRIKAISKMCINMHVGELDTDWREDMQKQSEKFRAAGLKVRFTVEKGQHHILQTMAGDGAARLFDQFEEAKQGCGK
jgi:poly(3-hydroxybutyrate) depolymerase